MKMKKLEAKLYPQYHKVNQKGINTMGTPPIRAINYPTYEEYVKSRLQPTGMQLQVIPKSLYDALKENEIKSN